MEILAKISDCIEFGKINKTSPYPPNMKDQDGADELTKQALDEGISANDVLAKGLIVGMEKVGVKFRENKIFVPQVLMSAKAMGTAMMHLKPIFAKGNVQKAMDMRSLTWAQMFLPINSLTPSTNFPMPLLAYLPY